MIILNIFHGCGCVPSYDITEEQAEKYRNGNYHICEFVSKYSGKKVIELYAGHLDFCDECKKELGKED